MTQISDGEQTGFGAQPQGQGQQGGVPPWTPPQGQAPQWGPVPAQAPYGQPQYWGPQPTAGWQPPHGAPYQYPVMQPYFVPVPQPVARPVSGAAIFAFVMSLLWLGGIGSFVGLILGISCAKDSARTGGGEHGLAIAAAIIGGLGLLFTFLAIVGS